MSRALVAAATACLAALAISAGASAAAPSCLVRAAHAGGASQTPLRFGIYPGGVAGSVNPKAPPRPENPGRRLAALRALAGSNPFVVRLYSGWTGVADVGGRLDREIAEYAAAGFQVELVVRYKPAAADRTSAPAAFADHVRTIVRRYGPDPHFVSLQVTNEANLPNAPGAADGAFAGAAQAVVKGVIAAKQQARRGGHGQLRVGFSWAYDERPQSGTQFWAGLRRLGGRRFAAAVDWVGLDTYPGTWAPQILLSSLMPGLAASALKESVRSLRDCYMPMARLGAATAIHVAENGFPTGPGRSEELQARTLAAMVYGADAVRSTHGVTDYRWFDLRDSASADPNIESQYGITRDDYTPKPAFAIYRYLIDSYNARADSIALARGAGCRPSRVKIAVPRLNGKRLRSLVVHVGNEVVGRMRGTRIPRAVRISLRSGRSVVRLKLSATAHGRRQAAVKRRTYRIC